MSLNVECKLSKKSQIFYANLTIMGKNDRCAIGRCNNARYDKENYVIKPHIAAFDGSLELRFWKCTDPKLYAKWTFNCSRKYCKVSKHTVICSNHLSTEDPQMLGLFQHCV